MPSPLLLTHAEIDFYVRRYRRETSRQSGPLSPEARRCQDKLLEALRPLVMSLAVRFGGAGFELDDLLVEGELGLADALRTFDPDRGAAFATHAWHRVRCALRRYVRENGVAPGYSLDEQMLAPCSDFEASCGRRLVLSDVLARLPAELSLLVWLYHVQQRSLIEIAGLFGVSPDAVRARLQRARRRLRRDLRALSLGPGELLAD
jgi:RNA polymerase sigma factor (sigma-70 family)